MANVTVYFATNRVAQGPTTDWHSYGADIVPPTDPSRIIYAEAFVEGTDLAVEGSGTISAISHPQTAGSKPELFRTSLARERTSLFSFTASLIHSQFDRPGGLQPRVVRRLGRKRCRHHGHRLQLAIFGSTISQRRRISSPMIICGTRLRLADRAFHIASFFANLQPILTQVRDQGRRVFLLAHSMGNFALAGAVESWFSHGNPTVTLFDEVFLPAADADVPTVATLPMGARLAQRLPAVTPRISIYYSLRNVALYLSIAVNFIPRLGHEGPIHRPMPALYPPARFRILNCAGSQRLPFVESRRCEPPILPPLAQGARRYVAAMRHEPNLSGGLIQL